MVLPFLRICEAKYFMSSGSNTQSESAKGMRNNRMHDDQFRLLEIS